MKKILLLLTILFVGFISFCQTVEISANPATSTTATLGTNLYVANESIYTETEIGATNFINAGTAINKMAVNASAIGAATTFSNVNIYMKDVPLGTTTFTTGTYTTAGYTLVFSGTIVTPSAGWTEFALTTPFIRTTGNNLQILLERTDNLGHASFSWRTANGNNTGAAVNSCRRYNNTTALSAATILSVSAFRAQIRLKHEFANDASVAQVYTLGKLPIPNSTPHNVSANIFNNGSNTLTSIPVTLNVTGVNSFTDIQTIASLAPGASATVVFAAYTPTIVGNDNISVTIPADDDNSNNAKAVTQNVNVNTWTLAYGSTAGGSTGFASPGDMAAKFNTSVATSISQVTVNFLASGQPYKIGIWDATGVGGTPGSLLFETASLTTAIGINVIPLTPSVPLLAGNFFVGVRQTGNVIVNFAYQIEAPLRTNTIYFLNAPGFPTWTDFATLNSFRFMIEPKLQLPIDANVSNIIIPSGNTCVSTSETVTAVLSNVGSNVISIGAASVTLKITGANPQTIAVANTTNIASGAIEIISFPNVNFSNAGVNNDTVFVNLAGDVEKANDTTKITNTRIARNIALETSAATYPLTANCEDLGWTYYTDASNKNVLAVEWGTNSASKAAATATLTLDASDFAATAGAGNTATGTFTMKRYWNIDVVGVQPTTGVNVRFFYDAVEKAATEAAAINYQTANTGSALEGPKWFKTATGAFAGDAVHVNNNGVINAIALTDVNIGAATINGVLYAQFNGIASFSGGGYATGVGPSSVLPVGIQYVKGAKQGNSHVIDWKVSCSAGETLTLTLERSADGLNFAPIFKQIADDVRCLQAFNYVDFTPLTGVNYYRLKVTTADGTYRYSTIVVLLNKENGFELISVVPNPVKDNAVLTLTCAKDGKISLVVTDLEGKIIEVKYITAIAGNNVIKLSLANYGAGSYVITAANSMGETKNRRIVKY